MSSHFWIFENLISFSGYRGVKKRIERRALSGARVLVLAWDEWI